MQGRAKRYLVEGGLTKNMGPFLRGGGGDVFFAKIKRSKTFCDNEGLKILFHTFFRFSIFLNIPYYYMALQNPGF
jgi:hypothetical protein